MYTIEKGVPLPSLTEVLKVMEVGDSIVYTKTRASVLAMTRRLRPKRFTTRACEGGFRVWRVE